MRPLLLDDAAKARAAEIVAYAERHHYVPGPDARTPGDDPELVGVFGTFKVVFSFSHLDGLLARHMTISVPGDKYPHEVAVFALADLFGFTGWSMDHPFQPGAGWLCMPHATSRCVVVAQAVGSVVPKKDQH